jgi:hypothetical protein
MMMEKKGAFIFLFFCKAAHISKLRNTAVDAAHGAFEVVEFG